VTGKNGRILFDRPKPTAGCSASGRRRRRRRIILKLIFPLEQAMKIQKGTEMYLCSIFNLGVTCGWVINVTPRPL
jgi:hypothetical protein